MEPCLENGKNTEALPSSRKLRSAAYVREHFGQCLSPMTDFGFAFRRNLAEAGAERRIVEQRIVPEAARASRLAQDFAFDDPAKRVQKLAAPDERDHADVARGAIFG